jgi:hypothetical protein
MNGVWQVLGCCVQWVLCLGWVDVWGVQASSMRALRALRHAALYESAADTQ